MEKLQMSKFFNMKFYISLLMVSVISACCSSSSVDYILINLEDGISLGKTSNNAAVELYDYVDSIPIETNNECLLSHTFVKHADDSSICISDNRSALWIDSKNGKVMKKLQRIGRGPGEYQLLYNIVDEGEYVYVPDISKNQILKYDKDLNFVSHTPVSAVSSIARIGGDNWIAAEHSYSSSVGRYKVYDSDWNVIRESKIRKDTLAKAMVFADGFLKHGNEVIFIPALSDTLYKVTEQEEVPYLVLDMGKYRMPEKYYASLDVMDRYSPSYITFPQFKMAGDYIFLTYYYNMTAYYDIWNLSDETLVYRGIAETEDDNFGFPCIVNDTIVYFEPSYISGNEIYAVLSYDETVKLIPDYPMDNNPLILKLRLR